MYSLVSNFPPFTGEKVVYYAKRQHN